MYLFLSGVLMLKVNFSTSKIKYSYSLNQIIKKLALIWKKKNLLPKSNRPTIISGCKYPRKSPETSILKVKGQIVSKGLFGILGFFQKTDEQILF